MILKRGLSFKLSITVIGVVLAVFAAILLYNYSISKRLLLKNVEENVTNLSASAVNRIESLIRSSMKLPENLVSIINEFDPDEDGLEKYLGILIENNHEIFGACIAFEPYGFYPDSLYMAKYIYRDGDTIRFENLGTDEYGYFLWDWYQIPKELKHSIWSEPYYDEGGGNIIMSTYSVPIIEHQTVKGIVTIDISLEWLEKFISGINFFESGYAFLISRNGTIITHPRQEYIMNESIFSLAEEREMPELREIGRSMIRGESSFTLFNSLVLDKNSYLYYAPLPSTGWSLAIVIPEDELMADLHQLNRDLLVIGLIGLVLLVVLIIMISSRITNPLRKLARISNEIGEGNFDVLLPEMRSRDEISQLNDSFKAMQGALKKYILNLKETTAAKEKIESEIKIARDIQQGILPNIFPPFPERDEIDLFAILEPARDVGGDLYDFFFIDKDHLCFAIGDVSGKGVPAALLMAITRTLLRAKVVSVAMANEVIKKINLELCRDNENAMFVTFFLGILNLPTGTLSYCNAGHNYPFLLSGDREIKQLKKTHGTPLGLFEDINYTVSEIKLKRKEMLILYTDGVTEAFDPAVNLYSEERLVKVIGEYKGNSTKELTLSILDDVRSHADTAEQSDDITIMVLKYY